MLKLILPGKYETFTVPERQKGRLGLQQKNSCLDCAETPLHDEDSFLQWFYDLLIVLTIGVILFKIFSLFFWLHCKKVAFQICGFGP